MDHTIQSAGGQRWKCLNCEEVVSGDPKIIGHPYDSFSLECPGEGAESSEEFLQPDELMEKATKRIQGLEQQAEIMKGKLDTTRALADENEMLKQKVIKREERIQELEMYFKEDKQNYKHQLEIKNRSLKDLEERIELQIQQISDLHGFKRDLMDLVVRVV